MRIITILLLLWCSNAYAIVFTDLKFSSSQVADTQWDWTSCTNSSGSSCQIFSKDPGPTWNTGMPVYPSATQYIAFTSSGDASYPWHMNLYNADGTIAQDLGIGGILSQGVAEDGHSYFFFSNSGFNGSLFSIDWGMNSTSGITITGAMAPTVAQTDLFSVNGSTSPLAAGQTVTPIVPVVVVPPPTPKLSSLRPLMIGYLQSSANTPGPAQDANMALDGNIATKYLNFDKFNTGFTVRLSAGKVVTGLQITTAEDYFQRDPASFTLYGSNDNKTWTTITLNQAIALPDARNATSDVFNISNVTPYVYYKIEFPTLKDMTSVAACAGAWYCNSMQIAELVYIYDENNPLTSTDTGTDTFVQLPGNLCCGASAAQFNANPVNLNNVMNFKTLSTGSSVYIDQYGVSNTVYVEQVGSKSNGVVYVGNGLSNDITITQTATNDTQTNYVNLDVNGNSNTINIEQYTANLTSFTKGAFVHVIDNNNQVAIQQKDEGNHYASVSLSGGYKTVNILQQGAASHMADVTLSGQPTSLSLQQSGATQQFYSINFNCTTAGGCQPIQVQQGQ